MSCGSIEYTLEKDVITNSLPQYLHVFRLVFTGTPHPGQVKSITVYGMFSPNPLVTSTLIELCGTPNLGIKINRVR